MKKPMLIMLIAMAVLFGGIFAFHIVKSLMIKKYVSSMRNPVVTVSTIKASKQPWQTTLYSTGSLSAINGVNVTTELAGMIRKINFNSGTQVQTGDILVELNADPDIAQLHVLEANAELAKITYERDKAQLAIHAVSQATVDTDLANLKSAQAQVKQQAANIDKKIIRAPFAGQVGITAVNVGQYLNPGDNIVTLQALDPIYADFYLPQQALVSAKKGQTVEMTVDAYPNTVFHGKISAISPEVEVSTRNVAIEATFANPKKELFPGMYATIEVNAGLPNAYITLPKAAISFNAYGELVYIVEEKGKNEDGSAQLIVTEKFVKTGASRGDQIAILSGIAEGDEVVTAGQLKLKKGSSVKIDNAVEPKDNPAPQLVDE